jgi:hypothetical protein
MDKEKTISNRNWFDFDERNANNTRTTQTIVGKNAAF